MTAIKKVFEEYDHMVMFPIDEHGCEKDQRKFLATALIATLEGFQKEEVWNNHYLIPIETINKAIAEIKEEMK